VSYVGASIGQIRIESRLGAGGMGEVYLGYDRRLERRVAVKTIRPEKRLSPRLKARFLREARLLSKIGHPAICQVYDLIETPEADFLILEYVPGVTLRKLAESGEIPLEKKLQLAVKIATALAAAHREKIVHRDLKADNIMVTPEGEVKVLDFGIARSLSEPAVEGVEMLPPPPLPDPFEPEDHDETHELHPTGFPRGTSPTAVDPSTRLTRLTRHGMVVGTLQAMSPEQATNGEVTAASDLYSFGILLQELITGLPAYEAIAEAELLGEVALARTRPIEGLDADLTRLIEDLESLDPRRRPTAEAAADRLRWLLDKPQRQRRQRLRLVTVAAAFVFLLVVLAVVSWLAVRAERARREAEQRRKQAESLISFMLGDLREKLRVVNRLDIMDAVGDRSLAYFDAVPESQLTGEELSRRLDAMLQIGEVRSTQGNLPAAMAVFRRAHDLGRDLVARDPSNQDWQAGYAETSSWMGQVLFDQGKPDQALPLWREALRLNAEQLRLHPAAARWRSAVAVSQHNIGTLLEFRGDLAGALRSYRESLALQRKLAAAAPGDLETQAQIAGTLAYVSNILERQGDLAGALAERRTYVAIQESLAAREPRNTDRRVDAAVARGFLAGLLATLGDRDAARKLYQSGLADLTELAAQDPQNTQWQRWLGVFHSALGALTAAGGQPPAGLASLAEARRIFEALVAKDPTNSDWRLQLGTCHARTAAALARLDPARARTEARAASEILEPLLRGEPDEPARGLIAESAVTRGSIEASLGNQDEARASWERALAILASSPRPLAYWKLLAPWTGALLKLDRLKEAQPAVERLQRMGYRNADLAELCREKGVRVEGSF
jgi:tetratricopeptide (TPR) repeat protein/tRNA A-37 threonylcarbamoyl transferase component Bud32